ncbi:hypothetical protein [Alkalicoccobacillus gibsonii]|jgi:hypothetical protein|uniref:hypothetical protein n=1 Tax=Alkalicoccobacillus gibsonii TaxID=79881 RepID=UPI00351880D6
MKKWNIHGTIISIGVALILTGCNSNNKVGDDLEVYYNDHILPIQADIDDAWDEFFRETDSLSDEEFYEVYESDLKPELDEYYEELQALSPETDDVRELHSLYLNANDVFYEAGEKEVEGHYRQDEDLLAESDDLFAEYDQLEDEFLIELERLMDKTGAEYE